MKARRATQVVVSKWGNSLAIRLAADSARAIGVREGDTLLAEISNGRLVFARETRSVDKATVAGLRELIDGQKKSPATVPRMRRGTRY